MFVLFCFVMSMCCNWKVSFIKACSVNGTIVEPFLYSMRQMEKFLHSMYYLSHTM